MKAIQFIKEHGVEKAREVVEGVPESGQPLYFNTVNSIYFFTGYRNRYFVNGVWGNEDDHPSMYEYDIKAVSITRLNRLVESVYIITKVGGILEAIEDHTKWMHAPELHLYRIGESVERLKQAIADYEAIYCVADIGDDTHIENHVSPNCKVGVM